MEGQSLKENIRKRPAMFLGNTGPYGVCKLVRSLVEELIEFYGEQQQQYTVSIVSNLHFTIIATAKSNVPVFPIFTPGDFRSNYHLQVIRFVCSELKVSLFNKDKKSEIVFADGELKNDSENIDVSEKIEISLKLDASIFQIKSIDFMYLNRLFYEAAILNSNTEIIIKDVRIKLINQTYHYFPNGLEYAFNLECEESKAGTHLKNYVNKTVNGYEYSIGLAFQDWWGEYPKILSYGNNTLTTCGGSLVDGIVEGFLSACRRYIPKELRKNYRFSKHKLYISLILVCSVKGPGLAYGGNFKETLEMPGIQKEARKIVYKEYLEYLHQNAYDAEKITSRFHKKFPLQKFFKDDES